MMRSRWFLIVVGALAALAAGCQPDPINYQRPTRYREAQVLYLAGKWPEAKAAFLALSTSEAYAEQPFQREALYYAARCDQNLGNWEAAVKVYNRLLATPPYRSLNIRALTSRGDVSLEIRDYAGAVHDYALALKLLGDGGQVDDVDHQRLLFSLGMAYYNLAVTSETIEQRESRYGQANQCFDQYLNRYPDGRFAAEVKKHHTLYGEGHAPVTKFYVTIGGSFSSRELAEAAARRARDQGFAAKVALATGSKDIYVVRVGSFEDRLSAYREQQKLMAAGFTPAKVLP